NLAICAAGSPLAAPLVILKSVTSTYMPSLLLSVPNAFPELQLSPIPLMSGESCQGSNAKLDAIAPIPIPAASPIASIADFDGVICASMVAVGFIFACVAAVSSKGRSYASLAASSMVCGSRKDCLGCHLGAMQIPTKFYCGNSGQTLIARGQTLMRLPITPRDI